MSLLSFLSSFFETSIVHRDAPKPKNGEVKEEVTTKEDTGEEEESLRT